MSKKFIEIKSYIFETGLTIKYYINGDESGKLYTDKLENESDVNYFAEMFKQKSIEIFSLN